MRQDHLSMGPEMPVETVNSAGPLVRGDHDAPARSRGLRRVASDPLVPLAAITSLGVLAMATGQESTSWAALGALAGYSLSGST